MLFKSSNNQHLCQALPSKLCGSAAAVWSCQEKMCAHQLSFGPQVQATVVGLLAAVAAVILGAISKGSVELSQAAVLCASSVTTAFIAALSLGEWFWSLRPNVQHSGGE